MSLRTLFVASLLALAAPTQAATVYLLNGISLQTSSAPGSFPLGSGSLAASVCYTCGVSTVIDDGAGNLTVDTVQYLLSGFGANFTHTFAGTSTLGTTSLTKSAGETCVVHNTATHLCSSTDQRGFAGNWNNGLLADGTTSAPTHQFEALASGSNLTLRVRVNRDATPFDDVDWLQLSFAYTVVPVPAAAWLFGGALGMLGLVRRRALGHAHA